MPTEHQSPSTGKERDAETGLDYFGARYYGSNMGRWMSPDWSAKAVPVPYADLLDPQTLNLYGYVRNNPLSKADLDGHEVDLTGDQKAKAEEQKRISANASKTDKNGMKESSLFKTVTDKNGKTKLVVDKDKAAQWSGKHSDGYKLLTTAIDRKEVATVEMIHQDSYTTTFANGNSTVHLDWEVAGVDRVTPFRDPANPGKDQNPFSIIAGHELLGHALLNMFHDPGANQDGPGSPTFQIEQRLRQEQKLMPRPEDAP